MAYIADAGSAGCAVPGPNCSAKSDIVTPVDLTTDEPGHPIHTCPGPSGGRDGPFGRHALGCLLLRRCRRDLHLDPRPVAAHFDVPGSPGNFAFADGGRTADLSARSVSKTSRLSRTTSC